MGDGRHDRALATSTPAPPTWWSTPTGSTTLRPYLWRTTDLGRTWKRLDGGLPRDVYLHSVKEDPARRGLLYLGTERGVAFSRDDGATWHALRLNLPTVAVHDLVVKDDKLVLATHGRSMWIFDDLEAVREPLPASAAANGLHVFPVPNAMRWSYRGGRGRDWTGQNPPGGVRVYYWLKDEPKGDVTLEVLDASGKVVNTLSSKAKEPTGSSEYVKEEKEQLEEFAIPKKAGVQRAVWNLAWEGAEMIPNAKLDAGLSGDRTGGGARRLYPAADRGRQDGDRAVHPPARSARRHRCQCRLRRRPRRAAPLHPRHPRRHHPADPRRLRLRAVRRQLADRNELLAKDERAKPLIEPSKALIAKLDNLEARLHNPKAEITYDVLAQRGGSQLYSRMAPLMDWSAGGAGAPTQGMREVFAAQVKELDGYEAELAGLLGKDLAALNADGGPARRAGDLRAGALTSHRVFCRGGPMWPPCFPPGTMTPGFIPSAHQGGHIGPPLQSILPARNLTR